MTGSGFIRSTPLRHRARRPQRAAYATPGSRTSRGTETDARRPSTVSLPRSRRDASAGRGDHLLKALEQRFGLCAIVFPLTLSVINDAEAFEIAQPDP